MKRQKSFQSAAPMWAALFIAVLWLSALLAYGYEDGMTVFDLMGRFSSLLERPFSIRWTPHTLKFMLTGLVAYAMGVGLYYASRENRRPGEEYGSAKWGDPQTLCRKYMDRENAKMNVILTMHVMIGMNGHKHRRNLNILVVGGSGAGKTQFFCIPGLMSANCSFLITDPKGEMLRAVGQLLIDEGYDVKVFNLIDPSQSDCYNPFVYLHDEKDVLKLIDSLIKNTTPKNASNNDPFWEKAEIALDSALILYLMDFAPPEEQTFETVLYMLEFADVREEDDQFQSPLDMLFKALEEENPNHVALKQYKIFKQAAGKTAKSILISAGVRLAAFNIPQYAYMTRRDDMDFGSLGEKKRAIFCVIPIIDTSMNYLIGMLYTQCFQELYARADEKYNGHLPIPVRVIQDEWANVAQPDSYPKVLATCRSYNIGLNIIVQNIQNIKALYEKEWESIIGNCDTLLFLGGGNEPTSLEFMVKLLGKETLDTRTRGQTKGRNGSSSTNYQQAGRELMMIDELRMMDTDDALLLIRGERPAMDKKYNIFKHPNLRGRSAAAQSPMCIDRRRIMRSPTCHISLRRLTTLKLLNWRNPNMNMKNSKTSKVNSKATDLTQRNRRARRRYWTAATVFAVFLMYATPALAASDPLTIVNNLSDFIFSIIKALGVIILGWGIVQVGMSIQSHDASQRTQGFLCLFGGLLIAFAKEILTSIGAV